MNANEFINEYKNARFNLSEEMRSNLQDDELRDGIYKLIQLKDASSFHSLLKALFNYEVNYRNDEGNDGEFFENIYHCAFFLFTVSDLNDVIPMYEAKMSNFDLGCGFDIQFLIGAGVEETINYLCQNKNPTSQSALEYIKACQTGGDFDNLEEWIEHKKSYFGITA